ncbi:GNAT family N-acetyltransferase [Gottfriedia acidiceleris]|uniref:GNAT family N-acetyltransferase n=1 Tax=Gottfriedia acidiceleris TaxID=371036 RepID=UPI002F266D87
MMKSIRLFVRELKKDDIGSLHRLQSNANVMRYITNRPKILEETEKELMKILQMYKEKNADYEVMAVCKKETDQLIGTCAVIKNEADEFEIGYRLAEEEWGNGYGSEIASLIEDYCFTIRKLNFIVATVEAKNIYSVKILEKRGVNLILESINDVNGELTKYYRKDRHNY